MKNEEWIKNTPIAEVLGELNANLRLPASGINTCIYNAFGFDADSRKERCSRYKGRCEDCIKDILSEEATVR